MKLALIGIGVFSALRFCSTNFPLLYLSPCVEMRASVPGASRPGETSLEVQAQVHTVIHALDAYRIHLDMTGGKDERYPGSW